MRILAFLACLLPGATLADLYRWVDPSTGSVRLTNVPPDASTFPPGRPAPKVERIPYTGVAPAPDAKPAAPPSRPAAAAPGTLASLQAQWQQLRQAFDILRSPADFERGGAAMARQVEAYRNVRVELDRVDPAGAQRRREEDEPLLVRLGAAARAQLDPAFARK